ncbi:MAG: winged helix DNA-binding domain-containing protein [Micrococcales bacterium]|nr:winged helix DNA-binding domain-containing protein [Micrococcales bacterium]
MRHIDDSERRARLATRHGLHPRHRLGDTLAVAEAMTALHATEAATVHLAVQARADGVSAADVDRVLYEERSLVKQLAMRRTLFAFPRDLLPAALGSASARVAAEQHRLVARDAERHDVAADGVAWLAAAEAAVVERLSGGKALSAKALREELPQLRGTIDLNLDKRYGGTFNLAPRVLTALAARGLLVRGANAGPWRTSRPTWALMREWLGEEILPLSPQEGYAVLVRHWLTTFGPGTLEDIQWWLGSTKAAVRAALADVEAVEVGLDGGLVGWVLPDDLEPPPEVGPWAALLPTLDPTVMGWKSRGFYLEPEHTAYLFDSNGNAGTTAWWDGRTVGAWVQDAEGAVQVLPCPGVRLGRDAMTALDVEATRLTEWLDGTVISNVYTSQLMKGARLP